MKQFLAIGAAIVTMTATSFCASAEISESVPIEDNILYVTKTNGSNTADVTADIANLTAAEEPTTEIITVGGTKPNPSTGAPDIAGIIGTVLLAGGVLFLSIKHRDD